MFCNAFSQYEVLLRFLSRQILISTRLYACLPLIDACLIAAAKWQKIPAAARGAHARNFAQNFASVGVKMQETRPHDDSKLKCFAKMTWNSSLAHEGATTRIN